MANTIYLNYINKLRDRIDNNSNLIQVILGPRQVGKTTTTLKLINEFYKDSAYYISADQAFNAEANWLREQWQTALAQKKILFIDEVQKCHNWAEAIKALYDDTKKNNQKLTCVLLGSSSLSIQKGLTESLTGRYQLLQAHHWNFQESEKAYGLKFNDYLQFGGYPGSYHLINTPDWYSYVKTSIISTVIEKDILQFNTVKNPALFRQAFEILISYPAQEISYTKLLGQLQDRGNVDLIKHYIKLYEGAYLLKALDKFSNKTTLRKASSPKILPLAPCLPYLNILTDYKLEEKGRVFECLVGAQLNRTEEELYYWREANFEVDFVLKKGRTIWAIEVKSGRKKNQRGLERFKISFPEAKICIITPDNYSKFELDPIQFLIENSI